VDPLARLGQAMLVLAALAITAGGAAVTPGALRARRRALGLASAVRRGRGEVLAALQGLGTRRDEARGLLRPWRRAYRWLRHPLAVELFRWGWRRRPGVRRGP
jgi:hypothetical protein